MKKLGLFTLVSWLFILLLTTCKKDPITNTPVTNKAPVANAGPDQVIYFPTDSFYLNGGRSYDPDGNIQSYQWIQLSGPACTIGDAARSNTIVRKMIPGIYEFELVVTDDKGAVGRDAMVATVVDANACNISSRTLVNVNSSLIGSLSVSRSPMVAAAGSLILFAGGSTSPTASKTTTGSDVVDIYDLSTGRWTQDHLSAARDGMAAVACGTKLFFAGGAYMDRVFDNVDVYDVETKTWTLLHLSEARCDLAAAVVGDKVIFAGGATTRYENPSSRVDIYDISENTWTTSSLSVGRWHIGAASLSSKAYFAGGMFSDFGVRVIDVYDENTGWSQLISPRLEGPVSAITYNKRLYFAGYSEQNAAIGMMETYTPGMGSFEYSCLSYTRAYPLSAVVGDEIIFHNSGVWPEYAVPEDKVDLFNTLTGEMRIGKLNEAIAAPALISYHGKLYQAGGVLADGSMSSKVYELNW